MNNLVFIFYLISKMDNKHNTTQSIFNQESYTHLQRTSFPSRIGSVGSLHCFYLSSYHHGKRPICSIGPSWRSSIVALMFIAVICLGNFVFLGSQILDDHHWVTFVIVIVGLVINVMTLMKIMMGDPGIPDRTYDVYNER